MTWTCPCGATFGEDVFAFRNHVKSCRQRTTQSQDEWDLAAYGDATEPPLSRYEAQKLATWTAEYGIAEASRRVAALVRGREAATARAQAKARAIGTGSTSPPDDGIDEVEELFRQRGTSEGEG